MVQGTPEYVAPGQIVADGHDATATVIAFTLGTREGHSGYQAVEWYFSEYGQSFGPNNYINALHWGTHRIHLSIRPLY